MDMFMVNTDIITKKKEHFTLREPTDKEFSWICAFISEFELDNRDLKKEQFIIAVGDGELLGFGRLREHTDCFELCSLGVITPYRRQGIGKAIVTRLIGNSPTNIYLVCIIPDFFTPFGFQSVSEYPDSIQNKMEYCTQELVVPEPYIAMKLIRPGKKMREGFLRQGLRINSVESPERSEDL